MLKIVAHHVGARGFGVSLNLPAIFGSDVVHVLYEADTNAVKRMELELDSPHAQMLSEKHVLPFCLGATHDKATLNITRNSYASSLFEPNKDFSKYYCEIPIDGATYDIPYGAMLEVVRQIEVEVHSLDELLASGKIPIAGIPDFLSIDTQGYELEILKGAQKALTEGVLGIISEVEMMPMYAGQPLLGDILNFATKNGFLFAGFTAQYDVSPYRGPLGARGKALPGFGDALFLRDISTLTKGKFPVDVQYMMLRKLSFIAISFGFIEYATVALKAANEIRPKVPADLLAQEGKFKYPRFLDDVCETLDQQEKIFPPIHAVPDDSRPENEPYTSWYNKYHHESLRRFRDSTRTAMPTPASASDGAVAAATARLTAKEQLKKLPLVQAVYQILPVKFARRLRRVLFPEPLAVETSAAILAGAPLHADAKQKIKAYTAFEELLDNWGFGGPAYLVRQRRLATEPYVRSLSPEMMAEGHKAHIEK